MAFTADQFRMLPPPPNVTWRVYEVWAGPNYMGTVQVELALANPDAPTWAAMRLNEVAAQKGAAELHAALNPGPLVL
jgi:hypothetical protein